MILLISSCCKLKKQTHLERHVPVPLEQSLFYQIHTLIADLCLLLFNLKMSITISNWGFICKCERYARKSQNDTTTNQIFLKTLTWVAQCVKVVQVNCKVTGSNTTSRFVRFRDPTSLRDPPSSLVWNLNEAMSKNLIIKNRHFLRNIKA